VGKVTVTKRLAIEPDRCRTRAEEWALRGGADSPRLQASLRVSFVAKSAHSR